MSTKHTKPKTEAVVPVVSPVKDDEGIHASQDTNDEVQLYILYRTDPPKNKAHALTCQVPAEEVDNYVNSGLWTTDEPAQE
jgi:hypothetical protein